MKRAILLIGLAGTLAGCGSNGSLKAHTVTEHDVVTETQAAGNFSGMVTLDCNQAIGFLLTALKHSYNATDAAINGDYAGVSKSLKESTKRVDYAKPYVESCRTG